MSFKTLKYEVKGCVAWIQLNRIDEGNSLNDEMAIELMNVAWECNENNNVRAVILTGNGKSFSFGGDLKNFHTHSEDMSQYLKDITTNVHEAVSRFVRMEKPIIAAVNGVAAGIGTSLVMLADIIVSSESAKFKLAYTDVGLTPDGSASYFLPRIVGMKRAMDLLLTNRMLSANEAHEWGIFSEVVSDEELLQRAEELANLLIEGPTMAYGKVKNLVYSSFHNSLESQMAKESEYISQQASHEGKEGVSAFIKKRKPNFLISH